MLGELRVDMDKCTHCETCAYVCFTNVIEWDEEKQIPYAKYPLDCQVCCICEAACPEQAITVIPDWSKKYYPRYISTMRGSNVSSTVSNNASGNASDKVSGEVRPE